MVGRETGIPAAPAFRMVASQIRDLFDRAAEAGGTNHRAVRTRETARGNIFPTRMFHVTVKQFFDAGRVHGSSHLRDRAIDHPLGGIDIVIVAGRNGSSAATSSPRSLPVSTRNSCRPLRVSPSTPDRNRRSPSVRSPSKRRNTCDRPDRN